MSADDVEPMGHAEWKRFAAISRDRCRSAAACGIFVSGGLLVDGMLSPGFAWHWWALLAVYALTQAAYHWFDERFWKAARLEALRMRRVVEREFPEDLPEFDRLFPEASE